MALFGNCLHRIRLCITIKQDRNAVKTQDAQLGYVRKVKVVPYYIQVLGPDLILGRQSACS